MNLVSLVLLGKHVATPLVHLLLFTVSLLQELLHNVFSSSNLSISAVLGDCLKQQLQAAYKLSLSPSLTTLLTLQFGPVVAAARQELAPVIAPPRPVHKRQYCLFPTRDRALPRDLRLETTHSQFLLQ